MLLDSKNLPSDITCLHQIIHNLLGENDALKSQLALLRAKRFGKSSEKLNKQIDELELKIEENESVASPILKDTDKGNNNDKNESAKKPKRNPLPEHLPR